MIHTIWNICILLCYNIPIFFTRFFAAIILHYLEDSNIGRKIYYLNKNCFLNQKHGNHIVFGSTIQEGIKVEADGMVCNTHNQNLWIYTADCMPILFADKKKRCVAAIHCGRVGLEIKIIKNQ